LIDVGAAGPAVGGGLSSRRRDWSRGDDRGTVPSVPSKIPGLIDWPFLPGQGPFHVKGISYRGHQKFIEDYVPGGNAGILEQLDPRLQQFYSQPFLPSCWYDLAPLVAVAPICAAACGISVDDYIQRRSRVQVDQDVSGVYAYLIKLVSARMIATRLPRIITQYFDFSTIDTATLDDRRVVTRHGGLPRAFAPWLVVVAKAYLERVLDIAGAEGFTIVAGPLSHEGEQHGVELVHFDLEVSFD
jgi:hypothetical protein